MEGSENLKSKKLAAQLKDHLKCRPNIIKRILGLPSVSVWKTKERRLSDTHTLVKLVEDISKTLGEHLVDRRLFSKDRSEVNQTSPWCDSVTQSMRDEVFIASLKLSKAFIDAAALPLRHNLGILMNSFGGQAKEKKEVGGLQETDLWSSLFLIVPCLSTTFASIGKMFEHYKHDSLGWLFIDEAGQATPQAAVGAIMRTKRAIFVGDPLQIEPIVKLPRTLIDNIYQKFGVNTNRFIAPKNSAQKLADHATSHFAEIHDEKGSRIIGFPLLVHRRCADPMFSISNSIAYGRLMIQAKKLKESLIRKHLGESTWFDVRGPGQEKWCFEEGKKVIELLKRLKVVGVPLDIYIITPFKCVAHQLRLLLTSKDVVPGCFAIDTDPHDWVKHHVGTIHAFQGKEAEGVILVLGAPESEQKGSRNWAGYTPNILNVAMTRAKEVVYVVGNQMLWKEAGVFKELHNRCKHN